MWMAGTFTPTEAQVTYTTGDAMHIHYTDSMSQEDVAELLREVNELDCKYAEADQYTSSRSQQQDAESWEELCDEMGEISCAALSRGAP